MADELRLLRIMHGVMTCSIVLLLIREGTAQVSGEVSLPLTYNLTGVKQISAEGAAPAAQMKAAPPAFSVVTLEAHQLSSGKVIECVRLQLHTGNASGSRSPHELTLEEARSQFPKAGSGWRKPSRAARALFETEVPEGCSAHGADSMAVQRGDIFEDVVHIHTPSNLQHCYAIQAAIQDDFFTGSVAALSINKPAVQDGEVSIGQIWVIRNRNDEDNHATLEAGWMVHPEVFEDDDPRLFIYWTIDNYQQTGCFNLLCDGFVQTDQGWTLGEKFPMGTSIPGDANNQQYVLFSIFKDMGTGLWYLQLDGTTVGYWDPNVVTQFGNNHADELQFGGEVQLKELGSGTQMGSGYFPRDNFPWAASVSFLRYMRDSNYYSYFVPGDLEDFATNPNFYGVGGPRLDNEQRVDYFFYGGLGA